MKMLTTKEISEAWNISERMVRRFCVDGRIPEAKLENGTWMIPAGTAKPKRKPKEKTADPKSVTVLGMTIEVSPLQFLKALSPISFTEEGIFMAVMPLPMNAPAPIRVTPSCMLNSVRLMQSWDMYMSKYQLFVVNTVEKWLVF